MELFAVSLQSSSERSFAGLLRCFSEEFGVLHTKPERSTVYWIVETQGQLIRCFGETRHNPGSQQTEAVQRKAADAMAEYILHEIEPNMVSAIARKEFRYDNPDDLDKIRFCCRELLQHEESFSTAVVRNRRKRRIADELEAFLARNGSVNLTGFITFRLASLWEELREIVAHAVDELVMDKQYQEFISLLRYFVGVQETKVPLVNLIHRDEFRLFDDRFRPVETKGDNRIVAEMLETEMNVEDIIVSTLISVSPQRIVIHSRQPDLPVIQTIRTIFEDKVSICCSCASCSPFFDGNQKPADHR
jgi:putative sporulation protein YtxC